MISVSQFVIVYTAIGSFYSPRLQNCTVVQASDKVTTANKIITTWNERSRSKVMKNAS